MVASLIHTFIGHTTSLNYAPARNNTFSVLFYVLPKNWTKLKSFVVLYKIVYNLERYLRRISYAYSKLTLLPLEKVVKIY